MNLNLRGAWAILVNELARFFRTVFGSILSPVLTTSLYLVVFGAAIGSKMDPAQFGGASYGAFIVPGLIMLTLLSESTSNASFGIYMPRFTGAIYELLSAPVGAAETLIGFVGAAALKSLIIAAIILGIWADGFEKLSIIPMLILTPLTFLGGTFYSITQLAEPWQTIARLNPVFYLINGLRWTFTGHADVSIGLAFGLTLAFVVLCIAVVGVIFRTGWRLRG
jgi:ABC-2 type transport system permease protein